MKHSPINHFTGSAGVPHVTQFVGVAVVDGVEAVYLEWYKRECFNIQPSAYRAQIISLKQQFNHSEGYGIYLFLLIYLLSDYYKP